MAEEYNIHEEHENIWVPRITQMVLEEYIMNIEITRDICIVKNKARFKPDMEKKEV